MSNLDDLVSLEPELRALEAHIESDVDVLGAGNVAAFRLAPGQVVIAVEVGDALRAVLQPDALAGAVIEITTQLGESARWVVLLAAGGLPRASAGAPDRDAARALFHAERLHGYATYDASGRQVAAAGPGAGPELDELERALAQIWCEVLGTTSIDPSASFFALGASSIDVARAAARVQEQLGYALDLSAFFASPTLAGVARALARSTASPGAKPAPIAAVSRAGRLPLSAAQRRMRFAWQLDPQGAAYNICGALELRGALDLGALRRAFEALEARHESLRTRFPEDAAGAWQQIDPARGVAELLVDDLEGLPAEQRAEGARARLEAEARAPFDLERGPLWRARVVRLGPEQHVLCVCLHHAIADGASMDVLVAELCELYAAERAARAPELAAPPVQYADYAHWQAERLAAGEEARQLDYWTRELADDPGPLALPSDRPRSLRPSQRGGRVEIELGAALCERVRAAARERDATVFMVLLAAFQVLLSRYARRTDVRVGAPAANRVCREAEAVIGLCVNTLVLRGQVRDADCFAGLLAQCRRTVLAAQAHQELPFDKLVEVLGGARNAGQTPLFDVMFNHQRRQLGALSILPGLSARVVQVDSPATRFELSLNTEEDEQGRISAALIYAADLFERERMERFGRHFVQLLEALLDAPTTPLGQLEWLSAEERRELDGLGVAARFTPPPGSVEDWIRRQAEARPHAEAVVFGEQRLAYGELERRADALARRLASAGAGPETIVGVFLQRCLELPVALLAILKTGAAYLPLDPEHPAPRLSFQLEDAAVRLVVTDGALAARLPARDGLAVVRLDEEAAAPGRGALESASAAAPLLPPSHPDNLAYVLYTSGSTGQPKAVANTRGALAERLAWMQREYGVSPGETLLHKTPLTFDVSVWEVFLPLLAGARVVIAAPGDHKDPRELSRLVQRHEVSTIHFVPSLLREFLAEESAAGCVSLKRVFSGGEALGPELSRALLERLPAVRLDNRYGPTEALINASCWTCRPEDEGLVPIGTAIPNSALRILDPSLSPLPRGLPGELCIAGSGLARGYLGRAALTAERFVPDPFGPPGSRLYRTGDQARFRSDGAIEFLGRQDEQVKIRGVRVELGELEGALAAIPGVVAAAARTWPGPSGGALLVAYVAAAPSLETSSLQATLEARLPGHLIPSQIVRLEALPRLPSGKLDRRALPEPVWGASGYVAPEGEVAPRVAEIWQQVLNVSRVGLRDDFFALGGHSLLATRVVSRVRRELDVELPLRDLFEARDLGAFVAKVEAAIAAGRRARQPAPEPVDRTRPLPLSHAQERMWFLWSLEPESAAYNVGGAVRLRGPLNVDALAAGLAALEARHEALRTTFPRRDGVPVQRIAEQGMVSIAHEDLSALPAPEREAELRRRAQLDAARPFDLEQGPLFRVTLFRLSQREHALVVTLHHIIAEGWAMDVFAREYVALYEAFCAGRPDPLPPLPLQYAEYAVWQRRWLASGEAERQIDYWRRTLGDEHPVLELPADRPRPAIPSYRGDYHRIRLGRALAEAVERCAVQRGVTVPMLLNAAMLALLHRYTGERRLRVGYPVANRARPEFEGLIGAFLNTQVLACEVDSRLSLSALVERVKLASIDAQSHQDVPFHQIVDALAPERSASHTPLFQVMCNVQSWEFQRQRSVAGLSIEFVENDARAAQFDLALDASQVDGDIDCAFSYSSDRFEPETVARIARHWTRMLEAIVSGADASIGAVPLLSPDELAQSFRWARGAEAPLDVAGAHELFEAQASRTPDAIAVISERGAWTYAALEARANQLAHVLRARGVGPGAIVGVSGERALESIVGLLGVLKAGAAYLPLDPGYPAERLRHMIADSGARLILAHGASRSPALSSAGVETWSFDAEADVLRAAPSARVTVAAHPEQLAYCIYTSGSTGVPKGVGCTHRGLVNRTRWLQAELTLDADDRVLARTSLSFDVSVGELLLPLAAGAALVLAAPAAERDPAALGQLIRRHGVTAVDFVPALLAAFVQAGELAACPSLRALTVGGEVLPRELARACAAAHPARLYNMYGPTEAAIDVAYWRCLPDAEGSGVPIGSPMANVELYVLDPQLCPVPPLVTGELFIGGAALARGYLGRPAETAQRFVPHPWAAGERLYRTGDLARRSAGGVLEFVGRSDAQVKVRGHRIELGEIEARLLDLPAVREAVVSLVPGPSGARLVAHVGVGGDAAAASSDVGRALRSQLGERLPDYMVPAAIVVLERLPRLSNGKLDRKRLPAPDAPDAGRYVAPETELEQRLLAIWRDVLGVERLGVEDNFFELGGDSILSLSVVHRAREHGLPLSPKHLFQHQTVRALAAALPPAEPAREPEPPVAGSAPLTPVQRRFFGEPMPERHHYNQALLLRPKVPLDAGLLQRALAEIVRHHDALRLRYFEDATGWRQVHAEPGEVRGEDLVWELTARDAEELERVCTHVQQRFELDRGPLLRAALIDFAGETRLLLAAHHLVVDGVSWRVLIEDLGVALARLASGEAPSLGLKTSSFKRWGEALEALAREPEPAELEYWLALAEQPAPPELPRDRASGEALVRHRRTASFRLDAARTGQLLRAVPEAYRTQVNDLLLAALGRAVCRFTGERSAWIELESHGRQDCFDGVDASRTVGWFTSMFPVRLAPALGDDDASLKRAILSTKHTLRSVPRGGLGFGVYAELGADEIRERLARMPRARVTFNYLGQLDPSFGRGAAFELAPEGPGPIQSGSAPLGNWLNVHGQVSGDELEIGVSYSGEWYDAETVERLAASYQRELELLIGHALSPDAGCLTPSDFPLAALDAAELEALPLRPRDVADIYPLTPMQQGLLFHAAYSPGEDLYVCQLAAHVHGLEPERFAQAWQQVIARHEILRTSFHARRDGGFFQVVSRSARAELRELDLRDGDASDAALERLAREERAAGFELERPPLMRLLLVRLGEQSFRFIWTHHHVLMDGWSSARVLEEVVRIYAGEALAAKPGSYREYVEWLARRDLGADERFWRGRLAAFTEPTSLAGSLPRRGEARGRGEHVLQMSAEDTAMLVRFARRERITLNTLVQGAWLLLLHRYTGQDRPVFGATVAGRPAGLRGAESRVGLFINTVPVFGRLDPAERVADFLRALAADGTETREHEHTPLHEIQRWAGQGGQALFDTIVVFENYPLDEALGAGRKGDVVFDRVASVDLTSYALSVMVNVGSALRFKLDYARALFDARRASEIGAALERIVLELARAPEQRIGALPWCTAAERARLSRWNATAREHAVPSTVHAWFEQQRQRTPDAVAVVCGDATLSYAALDARANRLAHRLRELGVGPDVLVGLCLDRSLDLPVALLGILKAGGAYVPLDPEYPLERLAFMMQDSGLALLVSERRLLEGRPPTPLPVLCMDEHSAQVERQPATAPRVALRPEHLAYCIYTSGSTGQPKGVEVSHGSLVNFLASMREQPGVTAADRVLGLTSLSFDISALEIYLPWCAGGAVVLAPRETARDPAALASAIDRHGVTMIQATPSTWRMLDESGALDRISGRRALSGGEALPGDLARRLSAWSPELWNVYGPTETTVWSSLQRIDPASPEPLIGRPLANTSLYVLGATLDTVPCEAAGELYIGGQGLARGYHGRPSLTAERFVPDPLSSEPGARMYRTGDLVRRHADGALEHLGRLDHQVKIRGHRIELGEIEARLLEDEAVRQAVVVAQPGASGPELVGYVVASDAGGTPREPQALAARLSRALRATLPAHMVPAELMVLDALPLTHNGKIDRRALPRPGRAGGAEYVAPRTELGSKLAEIWREVLDVERVGLSDNFFALGGHSLLATRVISRIRAELSADVPLRHLFETQSLEQFERVVHGSSRALAADDLLFVAELLAQEETQ
ncbi:amino acid adenylation domain-containing protein [Sorangium sp. So ce341]|uniref:amino acid adenylation domain-containing protein n=1 Tax=Sorangium sp. So ce341 TaxID=3133302 RepID=UPI003F618977